MVKQHEFNTRWWGGPVGVVQDPAFFALESAAQQDLLERYAWAEFCTPIDQAPALRQVTAAGFFQIDTQVRFRLNLSKVEATASSDRLAYHFADREGFEVSAGDLAMFAHERFRHIPGCTGQRINERYALWGNNLIHEHPEACIQLLLDDKPQGWFLSRPGTTGGINLALAMLSHGAQVSGMLLYQQAFRAYAERGHRLGDASFSVTNTAVHNIYSALGARFMPPMGNWLWLSGTVENPAHD